MKYCILICLLFAFLAFAREVPPPDPDAARSPEPEIKPRCVFEVHIAKFFQTYTQIECDEQESACQTLIEQKMNKRGATTFRSLRRGCASLRACENNAAANSPKCYTGENNALRCVFCCRPGKNFDGDLCNSNLGRLPPSRV